MRHRLFLAIVMVSATMIAMVGLPGTAHAATEKILYTFNDTPDGGGPAGGVIFDAAGNLYGSTAAGGKSGLGTVFKLSPKSDGTWSESVLYSFPGGTDGRNPIGALIFDQAGNLYGATVNGATKATGTVFRLSPNSDGTWTHTTIHTFGVGADGWTPSGGLIFDTAGNLYGATSRGGVLGGGTVFQLTPNTDGTWSESVIFNFPKPPGIGGGGSEPQGGMVFDSSGNLYGMTLQGGTSSLGNVFRLSPSNGGWTIRDLHSFTDSGGDGGLARGGVIFDAAGNLYGTTEIGGTAACSCGTIFRLKPVNGWTERVLHSFGGNPAQNPVTGLVLDSANNLYGTTVDNPFNDNGSVFKLNLVTGAFTVLHIFTGADGASVSGPLVLDSAGNLYGTTGGGGVSGSGIVYEITP
jgi:uncharacterized repeat protein (TIGR03803 family)